MSTAHGAAVGPRVLAVDWSGARHGAAARIRVAEAVPGRLVAVRGGLDRAGVEAEVRALLAAGEPAVVGLDFSFALPAWFARERGCERLPDLWTRVAAEGERWLAECPPPFWGRPGARRPPADGNRPWWRETERASPYRPSSTFQVGGAGAVGTGSLRGMPMLARLRAAGAAVWPVDDAGTVTLLEIYPRELTGPVVKSDPAARRAHVAADPRIPAGLRGSAAADEDAFDAACSAVALAGARDALSTLRATGELEGRIWRP